MPQKASRWLFLLVLAGGIAGFSAIWYASQPDGSASGEPVTGGSYVEGVAGMPGRVNPLFAPLNGVDESLAALVFAGLTGIDDRGIAYPDLAERWQVSPDGLVYTFELRPNLLWQDGVSLTADDVVFTYGLLQDPELQAPDELVDFFTDVTVRAAGDRTVEFVLPEPYSPLPAYLTLGILPRHLLGGTGGAALFDAPFNQQPVGAGPFRLTELTRERAIFHANPLYHGGAPYLQELTLRFYRDDGALLEALRAEEIDGALLSPGLPEAEFLELEAIGRLRIAALPGPEVTLVYFNLNLPLFDDPRLREALYRAIDRDAIVATSLIGQAVAAQSPLGSGDWAATDALADYDYDPAEAARLLDEAGWLPGGDGVRSKDGTPLAFTLATNSDPVRLAVAEAVARNWQAAGVAVTVQVEGATDLVRNLLEPRNYEAAIFAYQLGADPDPYDVWHSSEANVGGRNFGAFRSEEADALLTEGRLAAATTGRMDAYSRFEDLFAAELPALPLYVQTSLYVQDASLQGVRLGYLSRPASRFWQAAEWHVETE